MSYPHITRRSPTMVLILSILTLGFYLPFWYHSMYEDLEAIDGRTPTGNSFWFDFAISVLTFFLYGIWVDYQIAKQLSSLTDSDGLPAAEDTSLVTVILDVAAYATVFLTTVLTSAIHQDQLNKVIDERTTRLPSGVAASV